MHQAQGAESQQVGVSGTAADQVHFPGLKVRGRGILEFALQGLDGRLFPPGEQHLDDWPLQDVLPETAALAKLREALSYPAAELPHHRCQPPVGRRYQRFQLRPQQPGQDR